MKRWSLILLLLVLAAGLAIGAGVSMLHNGLSAHATPTALEAMLARNARHLAIPANARNEHNPVTPSDQNLQEAMAHFADHCEPCHGNDGRGDTLYGRGLYPKAGGRGQTLGWPTSKWTDGLLTACITL